MADLARTTSTASPPGPVTGVTRRWWPVAAVVLYVLALLLGLWAKGAGRFSPELGWDVALSHDRIGVFSALALWINTVLQPLGGVVILAAACLLLWSRRGLTTALAFGSTVCAGWLPAAVGKALVDRARPPLTATHALVPELGTDSFPSGHTELAAALVLAGVLVIARTRRTRRLVGIVGGVFALVVAASRLYLGVHYPSDVLGSLLVATAGALLWTWLWRGWIDPWLGARFGHLFGAPGTTTGGRHV
ncbi:phosphatase PAP2 family protein [Arthrobacter sp. JSM 101049]|uniref:phosphatase PAP2 family protein n=1 Tax=Arthrobacter sp. JSM 101049 TaxID=929097 RepID=UPI0035694362